jgi:hypothetical protein
MHDAVAMEVGQRIQHLEEQVELHIERLSSRGMDDRHGVDQQGHREERRPVLLESVIEHADDVGVPQR